MADDPTPPTGADDSPDQPDDSPDSPDSPGSLSPSQMAEELRKVRSEAAGYRRKTRATEAELDKLRAEGQTETEKAIAKAKADGATETLSAANARVIKAEVRAAAADKMQDPADAAAHIDLTEFQVSDDGEVDAKAIEKAIAELLKRKPYLAKGDGRRTTGSADGGARGSNGKSAPDMNAWLRGEPGVRL